MYHATGVYVGPTRRQCVSDDHRRRDLSFPEPGGRTMRPKHHHPNRAQYRSHDAAHLHPIRRSTVYRRVPVRRELARARRRDRGRCVHQRHRARGIEATSAWPIEHALGWADAGTGREVGQDEHVGRPTARCKRKRCRIQVVGGNALASSRAPRNGAVGHAPPAPRARWGVSRLTIGMRCNSTMSSTPSAPTRMGALFDNRWSGKNSRTATRCNIVERRRPARHGAMGRGSTRLPLLGVPAASSRRRRTTALH
jgi:hypothetical protein